MYEGMTPMQRALAKVKAQSNENAPKVDMKKESVDLDYLENVNEAKYDKVYIHNMGDLSAKFSEMNKAIKQLEDNIKDKQKELWDREWHRHSLRHFDASLSAIADFKKNSKSVMESYVKAFESAKKGNKELDAKKKYSKSTSKSLAKWMKDGRPDRSGQVRGF